MTAEQQEAQQIDVEGRQAMLRAKGLMGDEPSLKAEVTAIREPDSKPARKKRSDAGVPKPKKATEPASTLSTQCARIKDLYETRASRVAELETISDEIDDLEARRAGLIGSLDGLNEQIEAAWLELQGKG